MHFWVVAFGGFSFQVFDFLFERCQFSLEIKDIANCQFLELAKDVCFVVWILGEEVGESWVAVALSCAPGPWLVCGIHLIFDRFARRDVEMRSLCLKAVASTSLLVRSQEVGDLRLKWGWLCEYM